MRIQTAQSNYLTSVYTTVTAKLHIDRNINRSIILRRKATFLNEKIFAQS